jgi:hypothetical protein
MAWTRCLRSICRLLTICPPYYGVIFAALLIGLSPTPEITRWSRHFVSPRPTTQNGAPPLAEADTLTREYRATGCSVSQLTSELATSNWN